MRTPGFFEGAGVALAAAVLGSAAMAVLGSVLTGPLALRAVVAALGLGYVLYLLALSTRRAGRITALALWSLATATTLAWDPPLLVHVLVQLAMIWLLRALSIHRSVLPALADGVLCTISVAVAVWAADRTGSLFLVIWCLMLVQAAFVFIPRRGVKKGGSGESAMTSDPRFVRAHRTAEAAIRRLSAAR